MIEETSLNATRHRLLEDILLRLARRPDAGEYALRGGMLMRHWFRPMRRIAEVLDLVVAYPFEVRSVTCRFLPVLSDVAVTDGVVFDAEGARFEAIFLDPGSPGVRAFASGMHAAAMPRTMLRHATEHLSPGARRSSLEADRPPGSKRRGK